jgi:hypothetical protein
MEGIVEKDVYGMATVNISIPGYPILRRDVGLGTSKSIFATI